MQPVKFSDTMEPGTGELYMPRGHLLGIELAITVAAGTRTLVNQRLAKTN